MDRLPNTPGIGESARLEMDPSLVSIKTKWALTRMSVEAEQSGANCAG